MRTYDETIERVFAKGDAIIEKKRLQIKKIERTSAAVSGICAAAIVSVGVWKLSASKHLSDGNMNGNNIIDDIESTTATSAATDITTTKTVTSTRTSTAENKTTTTNTVSATSAIKTENSVTAVMTTQSETAPASTNTKTNSVTQTSQIQTTAQTSSSHENTLTTVAHGTDPLSTIGDNDISNKFLEIKIDVTNDGSTDQRAFSYTNVPVNEDLIGEMLYERHIEAEYYNSEKKTTKTAEADVKIYSVKKISSHAAVAVKFGDEKEYYIYFDKNYHPDSLGGLIADLALSPDGLNSSAYIRNTEYNNFDTEKVWSMLSENTDLPNVRLYCSEHNIVVVPKVSFSYTSPYLSSVCGMLGVSESGYIFTNIGRNGSYFFIGEDKASKIVNYVTESNSFS